MNQTHREKMTIIANDIQHLTNAILKEDGITITYEQLIPEKLKAIAEKDQIRFSLIVGDEYFLISRGGKTITAINATGLGYLREDDYLVAASALMDKIAWKFK